MKNQGLKPTPPSTDDARLKLLYKLYDRLFVRDGLLVRSLGHKLPYRNYVIMVPEEIRGDILKAVHDSSFSGHLGITRTEERVRKRFYWPGIGNDVDRYIKQCHVCTRKTSPANNNRAPLGTIAVGEPLTFWAMDYMGPLPETKRGSKHILVVVHHFTKWCEAFATRDQKSSTVAPILIS